MGVVKQIEIKNRTNYFYNGMINLKDFESNLLKIDKKHYKGIKIYYIGQIIIKKIDDYESIYCVNPLYLVVNHASGYIEQKNGNIQLLTQQMTTKKYLKSTPMFGMKLKIKLKQQMVSVTLLKKMIMKKIK